MLDQAQKKELDKQLETALHYLWKFQQTMLEVSKTYERSSQVDEILAESLTGLATISGILCKENMLPIETYQVIE